MQASSAGPFGYACADDVCCFLNQLVDHRLKKVMIEINSINKGIDIVCTDSLGLFLFMIQWRETQLLNFLRLTGFLKLNLQESSDGQIKSSLLGASIRDPYTYPENELTGPSPSPEAGAVKMPFLSQWNSGSINEKSKVGINPTN
jgi:hypothetical protein